MERNSEEKEAIVERQEISNEEVAVHRLSACRSKTTAFQEATEAYTKNWSPTHERCSP
jgi:hypothetical protein